MTTDKYNVTIEFVTRQPPKNCHRSPRIRPRGYISGLREYDNCLGTIFMEKQMKNELNELTIIRLQTELENCIGNRDFYLKIGDYNLYNLWDEQLSNVLDEIRELGIE